MDAAGRGASVVVVVAGAPVVVVVAGASVVVAVAGAPVVVAVAGAPVVVVVEEAGAEVELVSVSGCSRPSLPFSPLSPPHPTMNNNATTAKPRSARPLTTDRKPTGTPVADHCRRFETRVVGCLMGLSPVVGPVVPRATISLPVLRYRAAGPAPALYHFLMSSTLFSLLKDSISRDAVVHTAKEHERRYEPVGDDQDPRESGYKDLATGYYKLVTDFYEYGWGKSFHFAPRHSNESFQASITRHQHFIAHKLGLQPGMRVADLGCGVGGPLREIVSFSGANVVGVNISSYQLQLARKYTSEAGLSDSAEFLECDFMNVDAPDSSFDAIYAIEATPHAPDLVAVFSEARRLLKGGGCFATYEWCLTDQFDVNDPYHVQLKNDIELGAATQTLRYKHEVDAAFREAGLELLETLDLAEQTTPAIPWYQPLVGSGVSLSRFRSSGVGRSVTYRTLRMLETLRIVPSGASEVARLLNTAAKALAEAGRLEIFTPMYFALARKPI